MLLGVLRVVYVCGSRLEEVPKAPSSGPERFPAKTKRGAGRIRSLARLGDLFPPLPLWPKKEGLGDLSFSSPYISFLLFPSILFRWLHSFSSNVSAIFLQPLDPVPPRLSQTSSPNLETPPSLSSSRPAGPSRHQGGSVCPRGAEFSVFHVSVRDLLFSPYSVTG